MATLLGGCLIGFGLGGIFIPRALDLSALSMDAQTNRGFSNDVGRGYVGGGFVLGWSLLKAEWVAVALPRNRACSTLGCGSPEGHGCVLSLR